MELMDHFSLPILDPNQKLKIGIKKKKKKEIAITKTRLIVYIIQLVPDKLHPT